MVTVNNSDYYNNIPAGRDLNNLPNTSSAGTTVAELGIDGHKSNRSLGPLWRVNRFRMTEE